MNAKYQEEKFGNTYKYNYPIMCYQINGAYKIGIYEDKVALKPQIGVGFLPLHFFEKIAYSALGGTVQKGETLFTFGIGGGIELGRKNKCEIVHYSLIANSLWTRASKTRVPIYKFGYHRNMGTSYSFHIGITYSQNDYCFNTYQFNCKKDSEYKKNLESVGGYFTISRNFNSIKT